MTRTISIDFDHTICDMNNVPRGLRMGPPLPGALDAINRLIANGDKVIVHTVRGATLAGTKAVVDWLEYFKFPPMAVTATKPNADYYVDDKALRHVDWDATMKALM